MQECHLAPRELKEFEQSGLGQERYFSSRNLKAFERLDSKLWRELEMEKVGYVMTIREERGERCAGARGWESGRGSMTAPGQGHGVEKRGTWRKNK